MTSPKSKEQVVPEEVPSIRSVSGYPFFPCCICRSEGYSGKNNDGCDHTAFERARASGVNIHPAVAADRSPLPTPPKGGEE
jgi:hypothetical protein